MVVDMWPEDPLPMNDHQLTCADCGLTDNYGRVWGFGSVVTDGGEYRVYCADCRQRRGARYLFDRRTWDAIEADNTEPPEPDGEAPRGTEARAQMRDAQLEAMKLK